ncbi:MAG: hypothetical protein EBS05_22525 [Proteobacteria bacterium]|nr:hypothetical protein [Pseudomonadota bacterium]
MIPVYTAFGGIVLGAVVSIIPAFVQDHLRRKLEIRAVTSAIVTEIKVTLLLMEKRQYVQNVERILSNLRSGQIRSATFQVVMSDERCPIYKSQISKIGLLPPKIRDDIVTFYQLLESAICDVKPGGLLASAPHGEAEFAHLYDIGTEMIRVGQKIVNAYSSTVK